MKPFKLKLAATFTALILLSAGQLASAFYDPCLGRWVNRDPLGESGFDVIRAHSSSVLIDDHNLHRLVSNNPINNNDYMGLAAVPSGTCSGATPLNNNSAEC